MKRMSIKKLLSMTCVFALGISILAISMIFPVIAEAGVELPDTSAKTDMISGTILHPWGGASDATYNAGTKTYTGSTDLVSMLSLDPGISSETVHEFSITMDTTEEWMGWYQYVFYGTKDNLNDFVMLRVRRGGGHIYLVSRIGGVWKSVETGSPPDAIGDQYELGSINGHTSLDQGTQINLKLYIKDNTIYVFRDGTEVYRQAFPAITLGVTTCGIMSFAGVQNASFANISVYDVYVAPAATPTPTEPAATPTPTEPSATPVPTQPAPTPTQGINEDLPPVIPGNAENLIKNDTPMTDLSSGALGVTYSGGVLLNTQNNVESVAILSPSGVVANDTFLLEGEITLININGDDAWKGPRFVFRQTDGDHELNLAFFADKVLILKLDGPGNLSIVEESTGFAISANEKIKVSILSAPDKVSVWINDVLIFKNVEVPKFEPQIGMHYTYTVSRLENIKMFLIAKAEAEPTAEPTTAPEKKLIKIPVTGIEAVDGGLFTFVNGVFSVPMSQNESIYLFNTANLPSVYFFSAKIKIDQIDNTQAWHGMKIILKYNDANNWFGVMWDINGGLLPIEMKNGSYINHDTTIGTSSTAPMQENTMYNIAWEFDGNDFVLKFDGVKKLEGTAPAGYGSRTGIRSAMTAFTVSEISFESYEESDYDSTTPSDNFSAHILLLIALSGVAILNVRKGFVNVKK